MNNTFNITRFSLLLKRQWLEFGKIFLITLAVALGIIVLFYGSFTWNVLTEPSAPGFLPVINRLLVFREPLFPIFGFLFISVIASNYFSNMGQKPKAIIELMIPASTFEKFLVGIFFTAILSTLSFILIFYVTDLVFVAKLRSIFPNAMDTYTSYDGVVFKEDMIQYFFAKNREASTFTPIYFVPLFVTSVFLLGSIYFNRFHYILTAISVMLFVGICAVIFYNAGQFLFENRIPTHLNENYNNGKEQAEIWLSLLASGLTLIFWGLTYVRLKEKEV